MGFAASAPTQEPRWHTRLRGPCFASALLLPARDRGRRQCVVGDASGWVHCLSVAHGGAQWATYVGGAATRRPAVDADAGVLAVPLQTGDVVVLRVRDGAQVGRVSPRALRSAWLECLAGGGEGVKRGRAAGDHVEAVGRPADPWPSGCAALTPTFCGGDSMAVVAWSSGAFALLRWPVFLGAEGRGVASSDAEPVVQWAALEQAQVFSAPLVLLDGTTGRAPRFSVLYGSRADAMVSIRAQCGDCSNT